MEGIVKYISISTTDLEKLHDLTAYLDEIDRRRNLNWRQIFPWLDQHNELNKDNHVV
jgi:hypothetical protein